MTAHKDNVLAIPIQALVMRDPAALAAAEAAKKDPMGASATQSNVKKKTVETQGVFVVNMKDGKERAVFVPVQTGVTGATDIEVTQGLKPGDTIVTGTYRVLRTLKNNAQVKPVDAAELAKDEQS
jgi:HlyD family secretion protein